VSLCAPRTRAGVSPGTLPLEAVRARFHVVPKGEDAVAAGTVSPWEAGGISPFQANSGRQLAARDGRPYQDYGATP
jgi:hypothetical protein